MDPSPAPNVRTALQVREVTDDEYREVLAICVRVMADSGIPHCFIGGLASAIYGRRRSSHDLDLFVRPEDADRTLKALAGNGFEVERSDPDWIFKAERGGLLVDVIFRSSDGTLLDPELENHIRLVDHLGLRIPVIPPEDLLITKVSAFREDTPRQWFDCLAVLDHLEPDWAYLVERARGKPHRVLSLLLFAASNGCRVPGDVLKELLEAALRVDRERAA